MSHSEVQIPKDYQSWKTMITQTCKESLSAEFVESRLKILKNESDPFTQKMNQVYGENYVSTLISWFERAKNDLI